jgi:single-strand DNA-binding protein
MKTNMNKVELIGFAGMDPQVIELSNNSKMARLRVATSENYKDKDGNWVSTTTWHSVILWNQRAELAVANVKKGDRVNIVGKIEYRVVDMPNGEKKFFAEIIAYECNIIPRQVIAE